MLFGLHWLDILVLATYFAVVLYVGVVQGGKRTKTLGDFFVAGGKWGPIVSFIFIFASAIAGNEAVVVAKGAYTGGLSGVWFWWSFLFATPVYYLFATWFRRARVYNVAEFIAMRYGGGVAALYAAIAGVICVLFIGMFLLAIGKILAGMVAFHDAPDVNLEICIWSIAAVVGAYVGSGGMMSALITDILQGLMCLFILAFIGLPFLWIEAGGFETLQKLPAETWDMTSESMTLSTVLALNVATLAGGIAAPWIFNWISVARDERSATQCGWGHLWKRIVTLVFALYGILFLAYNQDVLAFSHPELSAQITADPELAWGITMKVILPPVVLGLLIASFFAAAMSSADTYATTSSAMFVDYLYRRVLARRGGSVGGSDGGDAHVLRVARLASVGAIAFAAISTQYISSISQYVKLALSLLCFLGIPIYAAVAWRRANRAGAWAAFVLGAVSYLVVVGVTMFRSERGFFDVIQNSFEPAVFISTAASLLAMVAGSFLGRREEEALLHRFHVILNTPVGSEQRLVKAGVRLPALRDAGLIDPAPSVEDAAELARLYESDSADKWFGPDSSCELRRESTLPWYYPGFVRITLACIGLVVGTWAFVNLVFDT